MITAAQILKIMPHAHILADVFATPLTDTFTEFNIYSPLRQAAFLAQIAHESGELHYVRELASGEEYEGREDLGNIYLGDGAKFRGRGLIQITGRFNYEKAGKFLNLPLLEIPELLEQPVNATRVSGWFWLVHGLNDLADARLFMTITRKINGGLNGLNERTAYYQQAQQVLGVEP